jgi:hypothetical protein
MSVKKRTIKYSMMNIYIQLEMKAVISQYMEQQIVTKLSNTSTKPKPSIVGKEMR